MGDQEIHAVSGVDIEIKRGEYVAIMGPSGSGKSTLMNLIGCLDTPTKGSVLPQRQAGQRDGGRRARREFATRKLASFFRPSICCARSSALHNVELPLIYAGINSPTAPGAARQTLTAVDLEARMHHKPNELSGGQRQRVAIARALVNGLRFCSPTNPPEPWIRLPATKSWRFSSASTRTATPSCS